MRKPAARTLQDRRGAVDPMFVPLMQRVLRARPGEERAVAYAFAYFFMLMCSYYLLRPLRDAMAIEAGLEKLPWLYVGTFATMLVLSPGFGALVTRVRKALLLPLTYLFFASNLLVFYLLFKLVPDAKWLAVSFFIWVSAFNMFVVSVFWSFMADVFKDEEAKRLFGPIAAGGGTGAILGPLLMQFLAPRIGVDAVVGLSMLFLLGTLPCIRGLARWAEYRHGHFVLPPEDPGARIGGRMLSGFLLVLRSPYLLGITAVIAIGSIAAAFMYNELLRFVEASYHDLASRGQFLGRVDLAVNVASWACQGVVVGWLIRRFELRGTLVAVPIAALASFLALAAAPVLLVLAAGQVVRRAGEYGIAKPSREVLFTIVDAETKYKAKNFIDTVLQRASDLVGVWLFALFHAAGVGLVGHAWICAAMMLPAIVIAAILGRSFERRRSGTS
jgi:ATP:ADP antiporter, AAA family